MASGNGLRFRDLKSMPDSIRDAVHRALKRDEALAAGKPKRKRSREPKPNSPKPTVFFGVDMATGPDWTTWSVVLPMRSERGQNARGHWAKTAARVKAEHEAAFLGVQSALRGYRPQTAVVLLTRCAPGGGLDDDNLSGSMKAFRDGVATALGIDDADARVCYCYAQEKASRTGWAVRIQITETRGVGE